MRDNSDTISTPKGGSGSSGFFASVSGTWRWTAAYGGDANNNAAATTCSDELVTISSAQVPTLGEGGMVLFVALLIGTAIWALGRRRQFGGE
jgi:hypothetical protein